MVTDCRHNYTTDLIKWLIPVTLKHLSKRIQQVPNIWIYYHII